VLKNDKDSFFLKPVTRNGHFDETNDRKQKKWELKSSDENITNMKNLPKA